LRDLGRIIGVIEVAVDNTFIVIWKALKISLHDNHVIDLQGPIPTDLHANLALGLIMEREKNVLAHNGLLVRWS
jgi:hypothetical protein